MVRVGFRALSNDTHRIPAGRDDDPPTVASRYRWPVPLGLFLRTRSAEVRSSTRWSGRTQAALPQRWRSCRSGRLPVLEEPGRTVSSLQPVLELDGAVAGRHPAPLPDPTVPS